MAIARERESRERVVVVVVGLSIIMPTTKQWGKMGVGLEFSNIIISRKIDINIIDEDMIG